RELVRQALVEASPTRRQLEQPRGRPADRLNRRDQRLRPHDHALPATVRVIVRRSVTVGRKIADVDCPQAGQPTRERAAGDAIAKRAWKHVREDRQNVDLEAHPPSRSSSASSIPKWCATSWMTVLRI